MNVRNTNVRIGTEPTVGEIYENALKTSKRSIVVLDDAIYSFFENGDVFASRRGGGTLTTPQLIRDAREFGLRIVKFDGVMALLRRR